MRTEPQAPISRAELHQSIWVFSLLAAALSLPLILFASPVLLVITTLEAILASSLFWGCLSLIAFHTFWDIYYAYLYPVRLRRLAGLNFILYGLIGSGIWYLALHLPLPRIPTFLCLGGIEGVLEHLIGIYLLGVLEKVPWLRGLDTAPILLFSFVEYVAYWAVVLLLAYGIGVLI